MNHWDISKLSKRELVRGLPKLEEIQNSMCSGCQLGKQIRPTPKKVTQMSTTRTLELIHMDSIGPTRIESLGGKKYFMVMIDDYTRYH